MATTAPATEIRVARPAEPSPRLRIVVGPCRIRLRAGADDPLALGSYTDPSGLLPLKVAEEPGGVRLAQAPDWSSRFPELWGGAPVLDLELGKGEPFALSLESGASETALDLGGLPITELSLKQGAGRTDLRFSAPAVGMSALNVEGGAGAFVLRELGNAGFHEMRVRGGAASFSLEFGGALRHDASVRVSCGLALVEIAVPAATAARVTSDSALAGLDVGDGFTKTGGEFLTAAAVRGATPLLRVQAAVALGTLRLRATG